MNQRVFILAGMLLALLTTNVGIVHAQGSKPETLSKDMATLLEAVRTQRKGIAEKDKYTLMDASELYRTVDVKSLSHTIASTSSDNALKAPQVLFSAAYCDRLIEEDFQPFDVAPITNVYMRPTSAPALFCSRLCAGESATFSLRARQGCQLMVLTNTNTPLEVNGSTAGKEIPDLEKISEDNGSSIILLWWQPSGVKSMEVEIKNPGNEDADFLIAAY